MRNKETIDLNAVACGSADLHMIASVKRGAVASSAIREKLGDLYDVEIDENIMPMARNGGYDVACWIHISDEEIDAHESEQAFLAKRRDATK